MTSDDNMRPDSDPSSSCGPASPDGDTPGCSHRQQHPSDMLLLAEDGGENTEPGPADSSIPTGNSTCTSPDLRSTTRSISSSSSGRAKHKAHGASTRASAAGAGANKAKTPNRKGQKEQLSKEDEERKRIRRERNKIAAAKCRNRRRELIDTLQAETDKLEEDRSALQTEIADLLKEKDRLEQVLASHQASCKVPANDEDIGHESMLQEEPASSQLLSIMEKSPQNGTPIAEALAASDMDNIPCIPEAAAILGNSNILLCASAGEEALQDLKGEDLDDLVPSLEVADGAEMPASVPDIDMSGPFSLPDWDTLYKSVANDLESLNTPLMSSSPTCSNYRTVFSFNFSEIDSLAEGCESFKGSFGASDFMKDSLDSPTLLAL